MALVRYTCSVCGLATRCEEGEPHRICNCEAPYIMEQDEPTPPAPAPDPAPEQ